MLVRVLDHHDRRIDHRADRNGDPAKRHDVGVHALEAHHQKGCQNTQRQGHHGDQRRAGVPQKQQAHERNDDEFLDQLGGEVID